MIRNHRDEELADLAGLLFSRDESNFDLAMEILKGLEVDNWSIYIDLRKSAEFFSARNNGPRFDIRSMLRLLHRVEGLPLKRLQLDYLPDYLAVLAPIIPKVDLSYNKFTSVPAPVLAYRQAENIDLSQNNIAEIAPEFWQLPALRVVKLEANRILRIGAEIEKAELLEELLLLGRTYTDLPDGLARLPNFKTLSWGDMNPKGEISLDFIAKNIACIGSCAKLQQIILFLPAAFEGHISLVKLAEQRPKANIKFYFT